MLGWRSRASQLISSAGSATQVCREVNRQQSIASGQMWRRRDHLAALHTAAGASRYRRVCRDMRICLRRLAERPRY